MAQVSKRQMDATVEKKMYDLLDEAIAQTDTAEEAELFIHDLMTDTEQTVLAKRLMIALMLMEGYSYSQIDKALKVSPPTVFKVKYWMDHKRESFEKILDHVYKGKKTGKLWKEIRQAVDDVVVNVE